MCKSKTPEYRAWQDMRDRCNNPRSQSFQNYGARGIRVCDRWGTFDSFLEDMGPRPDGMSLDRIDVDGGYSPENCRWATPTQQSRNLRAHKRYYVGVSRNKRDGGWDAFITTGGRSVRVGTFATPDAARDARKEAESRFWERNEAPQNRSLSGVNGCVGVARYRNGWEAYFYDRRKKVTLGYFKTKDEAVRARLLATNGDLE